MFPTSSLDEGANNQTTQVQLVPRNLANSPSRQLLLEFFSKETAGTWMINTRRAAEFLIENH